MPLLSGYSEESIGKNISYLVKEGKPHKQAIAIALNHARIEYRKKYQFGRFPKHIQGAGKFYKENPVSEKVYVVSVKTVNDEDTGLFISGLLGLPLLLIKNRKYKNA
jgi:hypothetical protein